MITTLDTPSIYRASIDPLFLSKVDRVFDSSPRTVFNELLQNARRAGATEVSIKFTTGEDVNGAPYVHVDFNDNGRGIESPEQLLRLAGRGWNDEIDGREDPAGMGFFCLSNFDRVTVRSREWGGAFTTEVFRGEADMVADPMPAVEGTRIQWDWSDLRPYDLRQAAAAAAKHCVGLLSVTMQSGDPGDREIEIIPADFMEFCAHRRSIPEIWVELGIHANPHYSGFGKPEVTINFYGVDLRIYCSGEETAMQHLSKICVRGVDVRVNVIRSEALQLVLPARNALKHNAGRDVMLRECERLLYDYLATAGSHALPFAVYKRALDEFGIDIGEAECRLMSVTDNYRTGDSEKVLVAPSIRALLGFSQMFCKGASGMIGYRKDASMEGYSWYDAMRTVEDMSVFIGDNERELGEFFDDWPIFDSLNPYEWTTSIKVVFKLSDGAEIDYEPVAIVSGGGTTSDFSNVCSSWIIYVIDAARDDHGMLSEVVDTTCDVVFKAEDDSEISESDQSSEFRAQATSALLEFAGDEQGAARCLLDAAVRSSSIAYATDDAWVWSIWSNPKGEGLGGGLTVVGPHLKTEAADCHKRVTMITPSSDACSSCELHSLTSITEERAANYMAAVCGYDFMDRCVLPVNLDAWEASQPKGGQP